MQSEDFFFSDTNVQEQNQNAVDFINMQEERFT